MTIAGRDDGLDIYSVKLDFIVQRVGWAPQRVSISFHDPEGETEEHLLALWRAWYAEVEARLRANPPEQGALDLG